MTKETKNMSVTNTRVILFYVRADGNRCCGEGAVLKPDLLEEGEGGGVAGVSSKEERGRGRRRRGGGGGGGGGSNYRPGCPQAFVAVPRPAGAPVLSREAHDLEALDVHRFLPPLHLGDVGRIGAAGYHHGLGAERHEPLLHGGQLGEGGDGVGVEVVEVIVGDHAGVERQTENLGEVRGGGSGRSVAPGGREEERRRG